ncbi:MAG: hypothetical protein WCJ37_01565 [Syntrophus sp. (in: bacteria)]
MTEHRVKVLIIDEDAAFLEEAVAEMSGHFTVYTSETGANGLKIFAQLRPPVVIVDAGISDIPFSSLLDDLKGLDATALRIATSQDYRAIEAVVQAIDTGLIYKYSRKPINYFDLVEIINARTVNYQVGRGIQRSAAVSPAYAKLHTVVDKAKEVEKLRKQLESQLIKVRDIEEESFNKVKDALGEVDRSRKKLAERDALISSLQAKSQELEDLKKRDIDRVESEREALKQDLKGLGDNYEQLLREKDGLSHIKSDNEKLQKELEAQRAESDDLRVSVVRERAAMVQELAREKEELTRMKDEAERIVEVQRERNKAELLAMEDAFEEEKQQATREIERLKTEFDENRRASLAEIASECKRVEEELALRKGDAERSIEIQKERNKAELQALRDAYEEEKKHAAWFEIEGLKAELERDREAKLSEIEQERKRAEADMETFRRQQDIEKAAIVKSLEEEKQRTGQEISRLKAEFEEHYKTELAQIEEDRKRAEKEIAGIRDAMAEEKEQLEKRLKEQREKAEADIQQVRESAVKEREKLTMELEVTLTDMKKAAAAEAKELKASATRDLDRLKALSEKKERELSDALIQARRMAEETVERLKLTEGRIEVLETEIEKKTNEKDVILRELESVRDNFTVATQSREALLGELAELRNSLK